MTTCNVYVGGVEGRPGVDLTAVLEGLTITGAVEAVQTYVSGPHSYIELSLPEEVAARGKTHREWDRLVEGRNYRYMAR